MAKDDRDRPIEKSIGGKVIAVALVAAAAVIPFLPAIKSPFMFDDLSTLVQNQAIKSFDLPRFFLDPAAYSFKFGNWPYRPLLMFVNALQYAASGFSPSAWHLFQLLLHAVNSVLVMVVARRLFALEKGALVAGLLFACAPIQSQAAIYISARSIVLACAPLLLAVLSAVEAARSNDRKGFFGWAAGALACSLLALCSSEASVSVVLFVPAAAYAAEVSLGSRRLWAAWGAVAAASAFYLVIRALLSYPAAIESGYSFFEQFMLRLEGHFSIARFFVFPVHLSFLHNPEPPGSILELRAILPIAWLLVMADLIVAWRKRRALSAGLFWYLIALLPSLFLRFDVAWSEHQSYLALVGLALAAACLFENLVLSRSEKEGGLLLRRLTAVILALFCLMSLGRSFKWRSDEWLYRDMVYKAPGHYIPWNYMAVKALGQYDCNRALGYLEMALSLNPYFSDAYNSRAYCFLKDGRYEDAVRSASTAVRIAPQNATYLSTLGVALTMDKKYDEARLALTKAREMLLPDDPNRAVIERNWKKLMAEIEAEKRRKEESDLSPEGG